jgi:ubiquinone/menaquinone biosynthesis C-methylase UbiE
MAHGEPRVEVIQDGGGLVNAKDRGMFAQMAVAENYRRYLQPYLFDPWARQLVNSVGLQRGQTVLDVAAGTGAVARAAASIVGETGLIIASDISRSMLSSLESSETSRHEADAPITTLECSATAINLPDASVDVVFCHQGFPFMPDRVAVAREMFRVLRPGGTVAVGVWALGEHLYPFDDYAEFVRKNGPDSSFARSVASGSLSMTSEDVASALSSGGFAEVTASLEHLTVQWPTASEEAHGITGTPFGPEIGSMAPAAQEGFLAKLAASLADEKGAPEPHPSVSVFGRGAVPR